MDDTGHFLPDSSRPLGVPLACWIVVWGLIHFVTRISYAMSVVGLISGLIGSLQLKRLIEIPLIMFITWVFMQGEHRLSEDPSKNPSPVLARFLLVGVGVEVGVFLTNKFQQWRQKNNPAST